MLQIKCKIGKSKIQGIGLFAEQKIPKGSLIWSFNPNFDLVLSKEEISKLSEISQKQILNYSYLNPKTNKFVLCSDDARFINHSSNPNGVDLPTADGLETDVYAARDIEIGEEITEDYKIFDGEYKAKLGL